MPTFTPERPLIEVSEAKLTEIMEESLSFNPVERVMIDTGARFCLLMDRERILQAIENGWYNPDEGQWPMANTALEKRFFATRAARQSGDFNALIEAWRGMPHLPFDYFVKLNKNKSK